MAYGSKTNDTLSQCDQSPRIGCPDLVPKRLSAWAIWSARSRRNGEALRKALADDNNFLGRAVLGQQGVEISHRCPYIHYIEVQQGEITILRQDHSSTRSPEFLHVGERQTVPPSAYTVSFKENTLLTMGCFPPHQRVPRPVGIKLKDGSWVTHPTSQTRLLALCDVCNAISWDELRTEDGPAHPHHGSVGHLIASSDTCKLCDMLVDAMIESEKQGDQYAYPVKEPEKIPPGGLTPTTPGKWTPSIWIYGNWWSLNVPENPLPQLIGLGVRMTRNPEVEALAGSHDIPHYLFRGSQIRILAQAGLPLDANIPSRTFYRRQDGEVPAINFIRNFLDYCGKHHKDACVSPETELPTRVLDLSELETRKLVKLLVTGDKPGRYNALSHCWCSSQPLQTTSKNFARHQKGIKMRYLSLTFRQTVTLCYKLGIQYLWIDSLCIIQDDQKDTKCVF